MANPEDRVIAEINRQIDAGEDAGLVEYCGHCGGGWHGLPYAGDDATGALAGRQRGCPGAFATEVQVKEFQDTLEARRKLVPVVDWTLQPNQALWIPSADDANPPWSQRC